MMEHFYFLFDEFKKNILLLFQIVLSSQLKAL
jgi:hypothetical protein